MTNHIHILHLSFFFLLTLSINTYGKVTATVDRSGGTTCNIRTQSVRTSPTLMNTTLYSAPRGSYVNPHAFRYYRPSSVRTTKSKKKPIRIFRGLNGKTISGFLVSINKNDKTAKIKSSGGKYHNIPIQSFCSSDIAYMKQWWSNKK